MDNAAPSFEALFPPLHRGTVKYPLKSHASYRVIHPPSLSIRLWVKNTPASVLALLWLLSFMQPSWAFPTLTSINCQDTEAAKLVALQGQLFYDAHSNGQWQTTQLNENLCESSRIRVDANSRATLVLPSGIVLRLHAGTVLTLNEIAPQNPPLLNMVKGFIHFISRTPKRLKITTPIANAGPEGTEFALNVEENKAALWVYEGGVKFFNAQGEVSLKPGQGAEAQPGQAPKTHIDITPHDAVNWALYYPPILPYPNAAAIVDSDLRAAIESFRQGRVDIALSHLDALPVSKQSPYFFKVRAAMRLTVGLDQLALQDIDTLLAKRPNDAEALALQSIRALAQNRKDEAYALAKRAVAADSFSATAYSALSYVEQSRFSLDNALQDANKATQLAPHDAMVWARKAEIELALGLTSESKQSAQQASNLDATLERTQTVLGFSYLLRMDTDEALHSFEKAIQLDSSAPLARLGLGLAKIRNGDLEEGRRDLEIATILDPDNSLIRSYLGKAYYEEKRNSLAEDQFSLAKERDPKDPTPYFYDAIEKQTTNRPVEALHDMQNAIKLNDNRGVYRSKLLLDKDLAARSAAQGRIYNELGFQQLGLLEGWKSVNQDSSNYSAHRLLADNYAALPHHEIARVSELLQSQLLQPNNITPIQANLAESNLFILNNFGASMLSYNEFNPLFEYNRFALQVSGFYGGNNTWGDNISLSGIRDNTSFSLGQFHYETNGFRDNNFLKKNLYNAFLQNQVNDNLNLQAEYRHEDRENGDLTFNFNPKNYVNSSQKANINTYRTGGRYQFNSNSSLIGSLIYQNIRIDSFQDTLINKTSRINGFISEIQHNYTNKNISLINGFGHINQNSSFQYIPVKGSPPPPQDTSIKKTNFYNYSRFNITNNLFATLGVSFDFLNRGGSLERNRVNPKFGIEWFPNSSTTLRAAIFRGMSMTRTANQTIEPTQVAGFNQLFDDLDGTVAWRYGIGIDHKFSNKIATGLEYSERKLDFPAELSLDRSEQFGRAYIYYTPIEQLALSSEYFYERIHQPNIGSLTGLFNLAETHRVPLAINLFHSSGLSLKLKATFVNQTGLFQKKQNSPLSIYGNSNFFVFDLNLNYRFPKRHGIITFGINNLFNESFNFQNTNFSSNEIILSPSRLIFSRLSMSF